MSGSDEFATKSATDALIKRRIGSRERSRVLSEADIDGGSGRLEGLHDEGGDEEGREEGASSDESNVLVGETHPLGEASGAEHDNEGVEGADSKLETIEHIIIQKIDESSAHEHVEGSLSSLNIGLAVGGDNNEGIVVDVHGNGFEAGQDATGDSGKHAEHNASTITSFTIVVRSEVGERFERLDDGNDEGTEGDGAKTRGKGALQGAQHGTLGHGIRVVEEVPSGKDSAVGSVNQILEHLKRPEE